MWGWGETSDNNKMGLKKKFEKYHVPDNNLQLCPAGFSVGVGSGRSGFGGNGWEWRGSVWVCPVLPVVLF